MADPRWHLRRATGAVGGFAKSRPEVWAIVPFLWAATADGMREFRGICTEPMRSAYIAAAHELIGAQA